MEVVPIYGIQGGEGSFNHAALLDYVDRVGICRYEIKYLFTTENVLSALNSGEIKYGQFAIHNTLGGLVDETLEAVSKNNFKIIDRYKLQIAHFLMIHPDVEVGEIDTIMAHPQVLLQCAKTFEQKYQNLKLISGEGELIDHAKVAESLTKNELGKNIAVAGPKALSEIYGLKIIDSNLQDNNENWTTFLLVEKR